MTDSPELTALRVNAQLRRLAATELPELLAKARDAGCAWPDIVEATGLSRAHVFRLIKLRESKP
jgi:DNA-binding IclR family transcriptional regulator